MFGVVFYLCGRHEPHVIGMNGDRRRLTVPSTPPNLTGFVTPRDLLRWAQRRPGDKRAIAEEGYMLLAERLRREDEKEEVRGVGIGGLFCVSMYV